MLDNMFVLSRVFDELQLRLLGLKYLEQAFYILVLHRRLGASVHHHHVLLREDLPSGHQRLQRRLFQKRAGERETKNRGEVGGSGHRSRRTLVRRVDSLRYRRSPGYLWELSSDFSSVVDDSSSVLQNGQLHRPVHLRGHPSEISERVRQVLLQRRGEEEETGNDSRKNAMLENRNLPDTRTRDRHPTEKGSR